MAILNITPETFFNMSPKEFYHAMKMHSEEKKQMLEFHVRQSYEVARFQATLLLAPHYKNPIQDPKDLVTFSWERQEQQSVGEMKSILLGIARRVNRKFRKENKDGSTQ